jgi:hypothetical protein
MLHAAKALTAIAPLHAAHSADAFTFVMNGMAVDASPSDAAAISPAVALQLSTDACARMFTVEDSAMNAAAISDFARLLADAQSPLPTPGFDWRSLILLFQRLWNPSIELGCLFAEPQDCVAFPSNWIPLLSVDAVDDYLSDRAFCIESEDALLEMILGFGSEYFALLRHVHCGQLSPALFSAFGTAIPGAPAESVWSRLSHFLPLFLGPSPTLDSEIVAGFPALFAEFHGKAFKLLWRGSRDGFRARDFHSRCDGHAPTLSLIQDTDGNIFGGFTPVEWQSRSWNWQKESNDNCRTADPSLRSYLFSLKNPHDFPARKFPLQPKKEEDAVYCNCLCGPVFGGSLCDVGIFQNCNTNSSSGISSLGITYTNDTGLDGTAFFTGSPKFTVEEIEVFEITD